MTEIASGFTRDWVEFTDPNNEEAIFKCDLTWLTSNWSCIYGSGCKGLFKDRPNDGCCTEGAMYSDTTDELRVTKAAQRLTPDMWQFYNEGHSKSGKLNISEKDEDGERKTRQVEKSCIFLNRKEFDGQFGCALHHLALKEGKNPLELKPDVCWQLPIRRSYELRPIAEHESLVTVIGEYERLGWGEGGEDFDWYCTSNTEAHVGKEPVYKSNQAELVALMGEAAYKILAKICDSRMELLNKRNLPLFINHHPATLANK